MRYVFKDITGSTNADALALPAGEDHVAVVAARQTGGRGRMGRPWVSPAGNLYVSYALRVDSPALAARYSFVAAVALARALEDIGLSPRCKWPNDVLLNGRKAAGILLETNGKDRLVVGIGVNLASAPAEGTLYPAAAVADFGAVLSPADFLPLLTERFEAAEKEPFPAVLDAWRERAFGIGGPVRVNLPEKRLEGIFYGLDNDGALLLKCESEIKRITAGDVFFGR